MALSRVPTAATAALLSVGLLVGPVRSDETGWTQWRGASRDGSVAPGATRWNWSAPPERLWETDVGGGHSGPIVSAGRVWFHARRGEKEVVGSLRLSDGAMVWTREYEAPFEQDPSALEHGRGPYSTPTLAGGRLFTLGVRTVLSAWDAETGAALWRADYSREFDPSYPYFGAAASPLVWGGLCFVHFGGLRERGPSRGAMMALRVSDGREVWRWDEEAPALGASPVMREVQGQWQLVFKTQAAIVGMDPREGRKLWRIPFVVPMDNTIVTPLFVGDRLVTSDYQMGLRAWRIEHDDGAWAVRELWDNPAASLFTSSPVLAAGQLVGFSGRRRGQLLVLDPRDGRISWEGEPRSGEHASLIAWADEVLVFHDDGSLVVGRVSTHGFQAFVRHRLGSAMMWAHPAVVGDRIVLKDWGRIIAYGPGQEGRPAP